MLRSLWRALLGAAVILGCGGAAKQSEVSLPTPLGSAAPADSTVLVQPTGKDERTAAVPVMPSDATWGSRKALVTIVEFDDFQCPFCARAADTVAQLEDRTTTARPRAARRLQALSSLVSPERQAVRGGRGHRARPRRQRGVLDVSRSRLPEPDAARQRRATKRRPGPANRASRTSRSSRTRWRSTQVRAEDRGRRHGARHARGRKRLRRRSSSTACGS